MKLISLIARRPDIGPAEFRRHYEEVHAPLALEHFPFERYVRNHIIEASVPLAFDCLTESWIDYAAVERIMAGPLAQLLNDDQARFIAPPTPTAAVAEYELFAHGAHAPISESIDIRFAGNARLFKQILLLRGNFSENPVLLRREWSSWLTPLSEPAAVARVVLDRVIDAASFGADAVLSIWSYAPAALADEKLPTGIAALAAFTVEHCE